MISRLGFRRFNEEMSSSMTMTFASSMSMAEMQAKIDMLPRYLNSDLTIQFSDGTYVSENGATLKFGGFSGPGTLSIQGNESESGLHTNQAVVFTLGLTHQANCFEIRSCSCPVVVKNLRFNRSSSILEYFTSVQPVVSNDVTVQGCCFDSQSQSCRGIFSSFSNFRAYNNYFGAVYVGVWGYYCSTVLAWDNDDISSGNKPSYSYASQYGSTFGYYGTVPAYVTAEMSTASGSRTWT